MTVPVPITSDNKQVFDTEECCASKPALDQNRILIDADDVVPKDAADASPDDDFTRDYVLVVPKRLTKHAQNILFARRALPMSWNLEGRFGSRTFRVDDAHMGIPVAL